MIIEFTVAGEPQTKGSAKAFRHRTTGKIVVRNDNAKCATWASTVSWRAKRAASSAGLSRPLAVPVRVTAAFSLALPPTSKLPAPRLDVDKLVRAVLDALTGIVYVDDKQVVELAARKAWGEPGVAIIVSPIGAAP